MHDPDCTFKPKITARSANLQARSVLELSRGDQLKRETTQRLTRLRAEQVRQFMVADEIVSSGDFWFVSPTSESVSVDLKDRGENKTHLPPVQCSTSSCFIFGNLVASPYIACGLGG